MTHIDEPTSPDDFLAALADPPFTAPLQAPPEPATRDVSAPADLVELHQPLPEQPALDIAVDPNGDRQDFEEMLAFIRAHADPATVVAHLSPAEFLTGLVDLPSTLGDRQ